MAKFSVILFVLFVYVADSKIQVKNPNNIMAQTPVVEKKKDCVKMDFHYLELDDYSYETSTLKHVEIFLDEKAFNEKNLAILLGYLSDKYSKWKYLVVVVHTNWAQLQFPSDCPGSGISEQPADPHEFDYQQAVMYRTGENQFFNYNPVLKNSEMKTVIVKGKHCWITSGC